MKRKISIGITVLGVAAMFCCFIAFGLNSPLYRDFGAYGLMLVVFGAAGTWASGLGASAEVDNDDWMEAVK